ncbi:SPOR domain-containing protein [Rhizobium sp. L1K21]|uniref:SPOR domain-containing protein n=1 Tax=Rhizobium sp. L1K21 TaxID=2954933 RepID=UPI00209382B6|nr:SPOR domain-containing protein [Rhizobium sp. L1K21]MCO6186157.1 SPOR domain-containing protein [Rhizobium sp. L1K21]
MADRNWTGNANRASGFVDDDDPFAALTRLVELDASNHPERAEPTRESPVADSRTAPSDFDLEAELLQEFERYDAGSAIQFSRDAETKGQDAAPLPEPSVEQDTDPSDIAETMSKAQVALDEPSLESDLQDAMANELGMFAGAVEADEPTIDTPFSGPVPDIEADFGESETPIEEAAFSGPVPDLEAFSEGEFGIDDSDIAFAGPSPDFDFDADFSAAPTGAAILDDISVEDGEVSADDLMAGELEMSLGIPEKEAPAASEPVSAFAEWKNERLSVNSSTLEERWVPEPVLGHPGEALNEADDKADDAFAPAEDFLAVDDFAEEETIPPVAAAPIVTPPPKVEPVWQETTDPLAELQAIMGKATPAPASTNKQAPEEDLDFDIDFDTLEMDLASVELDELENIDADAVGASQARSASSERPADELVFDPAQINPVDLDAEFIADLEIPHVPMEDAKTADSDRNYEYEFEAEMAELLSENLGVAAAASAVKAREDEPVTVAFERELEEELHDVPPAAVDYSRDLLNFQEYDERVDPLGRNRRGGVWMAVAAGAAVVVIVGGAFAWLNSGSGNDTVFSGDGEPPIIAADNTPFKEVPADKGGAVVPNQDKAVYDQVEGNSVDTVKQEALISSEEAPVDVAQQTAQENILPLEINGEETADAFPQDDRLLPSDENAGDSAGEGKPATIAPRKVKTMIVMPDGTLVARETPEPEAAQTASSAGENATDETATNSETGANDTNTSQSAVEQAANAQVDETAPVRPVQITEVPGAPVPTPRPNEQPVNVVSTVTERGNVSAPSTPSAPATENQAAAPAAPVQQTNVPTGSYVVQIASLPSQESAEKTYANLSSRFASVIGGRGVDIQRADIEGKGTYYRVRIPAGTRDEAVDLCQRYKAAGGSCLVSR